MRTPSIDNALVVALSMPRLSRYLHASNGIVDAALSLYERNARIAEAFHAPLHRLEVCLRNHMDLQLSKQFGTHWYKNGGPPFKRNAVEKLDSAMDEVQHKRKSVTPGGVVSELNFGFWVMALGREYETDLWRSTFSPIFLESGRRMRRQRVHNRMNELRLFRNRIAHHEPVYHLNPSKVHDDIIDAIAWICPSTAAWAIEHSRVPEVLAGP